MYAAPHAHLVDLRVGIFFGCPPPKTGGFAQKGENETSHRKVLNQSK